MFKDTIPGLNKIFDTDIPKGHVVIITGTAGSLKSAFVYDILSGYLRDKKGEKGVYITLEEAKKSHLENMASLGIEVEPRLKVSDIASFREHIGYEHIDYLDVILHRINGHALNVNMLEFDNGNKINNNSANKTPKKKSKITCFALDSLNALYSLINIDEFEMRNKLLELFSTLRNKKLTSFIVLELSKDTPYSNEFFLADGIIEFGIMASAQKSLKRYIQVKKMRATKHSLEPFVIEVGKKGLKVVGKLIS